MPAGRTRLRGTSPPGTIRMSIGVIGRGRAANIFDHERWVEYRKNARRFSCHQAHDRAPDEWLMALASPLLPLQQVPVEHLGGFQWAFREQTECAVCVGKAVRMVSGIRVALM